MIVGWDAYYIPQANKDCLEFFLFVSHDSFLDIVTNTEKSYERVMEILQRFSWMRIKSGT